MVKNAVLQVLFFAMVAVSGRAEAEALFQAGQYHDAAVIFLSLLKDAPGDADILEKTGRSFLALGAPERARTYFEHEIAMSPLRREGYRWLAAAWAGTGMTAYSQGYYQAAAEAFGHALTQDVGIEPGAERNRIEVVRGICLVETGASDEAARVLPELLGRQENAGNVDLLLSDVRLLYETGHFAEAMAVSGRAVAVAPGNGAAHLWRARLYQESGDLKNATAEAERARDLVPASAGPRSLLVRLYARQGREADSKREAEWLRGHGQP